MLDHIEAEHPNLKQDSEELREIESCVVAPDERQPGRAYERVQEILLELYGLRQRLGLNGSDEPTFVTHNAVQPGRIPPAPRAPGPL